MGELMESLLAIMGLAAGLMVILTTLLHGEAPHATERNESYHEPRTIRPQNEQIAA